MADASAYSGHWHGHIFTIFDKAVWRPRLDLRFEGSPLSGSVLGCGVLESLDEDGDERAVRIQGTYAMQDGVCKLLLSMSCVDDLLGWLLVLTLDGLQPQNAILKGTGYLTADQHAVGNYELLVDAAKAAGNLPRTPGEPLHKLASSVDWLDPGRFELVFATPVEETQENGRRSRSRSMRREASSESDG